MAASRTKQTSTRWCFTINNPEDTDNPKEWPDLKYLVYQLETGEGETPHYQGFVIFSKNKRFSGVKKLNGRAHWEMTKDTNQFNDHYCSKPHAGCSDVRCCGKGGERLEGPWRVGILPTGPGCRTDILAVKAALDSGRRLDALVQDDEFHEPIMSNLSSYKFYSALVEKPRDHKTLSTISFGSTEVGKSRHLRVTYPDAYWKVTDNRWWCGYRGQEHVVIDEYYCQWLPHELLVLLDENPYPIQIKGSSAHFISRCVHFTTNQNPFDWYKEIDTERRKALFRRFTCIVEVKSRTERKYHKYPEPGSEEYEYLRPFFGTFLPVPDSSPSAPPPLAMEDDDDITEIPSGPSFSPLFTPGTSIDRPHFSKSITARTPLKPTSPKRTPHYTPAQLSQALALLEEDSYSDSEETYSKEY